MELERLKRISNLNDRKLAREIFYNIHEDVENYNLNLYSILEKEIYNEIKDPLEKFYVYTTMEYKQNLNANDEFMFPMLEKNYTLFLDCDLDKFNEILSSNKVYKGVLKTAEHEHNIEATISKSYKYIEQIERLYEVFNINKIDWHTINCPYIYRFVDINILLPSNKESDQPSIFDNFDLEENDDIVEIDINLGEYEQYKKTNLIPLWNINFLEKKDDSFSHSENSASSIHNLNMDMKNGYLVDKNNEYFSSYEYKETQMVILANSTDRLVWNIVSITMKNDNTYSYEVYSNRRNLNFISRYAILNESIVPTKGEVSRLVKIYELSSQFEFVDIEIVSNFYEPIRTIAFNSFILDDIRIEGYKNIMLVTFKNKLSMDHLQYEKISFFISEIQLYFLEYKCVGEIIG